MNITVKFSTETREVKMDVRGVSCKDGRIILHYDRGNERTTHSESIEHVERLYLEAYGARALVKARQQKETTFENVRTLEMTRNSMLIEEGVGKMSMGHDHDPRELEYLEIS